MTALPAFIVGMIGLAIAAVLADFAEGDRLGFIVRALARRYRRARAWRDLAQRQRSASAAPDRTTARGVNPSAFQSVPRS